MKLEYKDVKPYAEALKEVARVAVIAAIPVLIDGLTNGEINWRLVASVTMIAALRGIDKLLHVEGKVSGNDALTGGLVRF